MKDNTIYVLTRSIETIGVFSTRRMLRKAVDHYSQLNPNCCLHFQAFMKNYIPGNLGKTCWAYLQKDVVLPPYTEDGIVPAGVNLVGKPGDDIEV